MASSNVLAQSTTSQRSDVAEDLISPHPFIGPGVFNLVSFTTENDTGNDTTRAPRSTEEHLSEKLKGMDLRKTSLTSRIPTRQKKPSVTPYYRRPQFVRARTPEAPRQHKRQRQSAVIVDLKELQKVGKSTQ